MPNDKLLSVVEAAEALHLSPWTIRMWLVRGKIGSVKLGRAVRIPQAEILRLVSEGSRPARVASAT